jgi:hypothetical protein
VEVTDYNAIVTRSEPGWSIYVPEVDRHTYAAHLREVEEMARDLVAVMTDLPAEDITLTIHLPSELADAIAEMHRARESVTVAENAARYTQQAAAIALRDVGAPLRDIAAAIGVSYQRVHQILEDASRQLDQFRREIDCNLAFGALQDFTLPVTDDGHPVVVALAYETVATLTARVLATGGYANLFVKDGPRTRFAAFVDETCAVGEADTTMIGDEAPSASSTVGMFLDYVERHPNGVTISAVLGHPAWVRDARQVELSPC